MSIFKKITSAGETEFYHYRFRMNGKTYCGTCKGCTKKPDAEKYEKNVRNQVIILSNQKNVKALVENFRDQLTGGSGITLADAYELSLEKPGKREPSLPRIKFKRTYWQDFTSFMQDQFSDVKTLANVRRTHVEAYIKSIRTNGRYVKTVTFKVGRKPISVDGKMPSDKRKKMAQYQVKGNLSNSTCNTIQQTLSEVFDKLFDDAGLVENPVKDIPKLANEQEDREIFTEKELKCIRENADDFILPLFLIGITTALREGDICTLRWKEIDLDNNVITRKMQKTRHTVEIPIMPPLRTFLIEQQEKSGDSEFVLPEHAAMYLDNRTGISFRVKRFLENIGINTTRKVENRHRAISVKDLHSLRHCFCYYAGAYGIPFLVVKDIVGHVSPQMTELYQSHADNRLKREKLTQMPDFMSLSAHLGELLPELKQVKNRLINLIENSIDIEKVKQAISIFDKNLLS